MTKKFWQGTDPTRCDVCSEEIVDVFYDAQTKTGRWACMCPMCHTFGPGMNILGLGKGQKYEKQSSGRFLKTEG